MANPVTHFEIPAKDKEVIQKFYGDAFGWTFNSMPDIDYTMVMTTPTDETMMPTKNGEINGGMFVKDENTPSQSPVLVLATDDVEASCAKLKECGGEVLMGPQQVADMGIYAQFKDPEGNVLGLWQSLPKQ